ncbi:MAG: hypothetical protein LLG20_15560 [Acidobacteriales bacterium]|nr:hypothetical protein [Terriglobales bacterium]
MWRRALQRHCSDDALLAHADGELSPLVNRIVMCHLKQCWQCRARLEELEVQAHALARTLHEVPLFSAEHIAQVRARLLSGQQELERQHAGTPAFLPRTASIPFRSLAVAGVSFLLVVLGFSVYLTRSDRIREPKEVLSRAKEREQAVLNTPLMVHQTMRVEIGERAPRRTSVAGRLEIWSESPQGQFALRWEDDQGIIRHAVWRGPGAGMRAYSTASSASITTFPPPVTPVENMADFAAYGLDPAMLEAAFLKWLDHWQGRPISLSADFSMFACRGDVVLAVERVRMAGDAHVIRFSAVRIASGIRTEIVMDVDAKTWKSQLQRVRFDTPQKSVEFQLAVETLQLVSHAAIPPEVSRSRDWLRQTLSLEKPKSPEEARAAQPALSPGDNLDRIEVEVLYALHRIRACLGEPVEIVRSPSGRILVEGLVKSTERKNELLTVLGELGHADALSVSIRAMSEVTVRATQPSALTGSVTTLTADRLPVENQLEAYFRARAKRDGVPAEDHITKFTNDAISGGEEALSEAWALRRLVERYPLQKCRQMDQHHRLLLESMFRDHLAALRTRVADVRRLVEPVMLHLGGAPAGEIATLPALQDERAGSLSNRTELRAFDMVRRIDELLLRLFSNGRESSVGAGDARIKESALELLRLSRNLEDDFGILDAEVNRSFPVATQVKSRNERLGR